MLIKLLVAIYAGFEVRSLITMSSPNITSTKTKINQLEVDVSLKDKGFALMGVIYEMKKFGQVKTFKVPKSVGSWSMRNIETVGDGLKSSISLPRDDCSK